MIKKTTHKVDLRSRKTEYLTNNEILDFFEPSQEMDEITKIGNTYIVGHKGSGKSFILKYLSLPLQLLRKKNDKNIDFDNEAIGFLIPCHVDKFGGLAENPNEQNLDKKWIKTFTHTFNLSALGVIFESLEILENTNTITKSEILMFTKKIFKNLRINSAGLNFEKAKDLIEDELSDLEDEYRGDKSEKIGRHYTDHNFLYNLRLHFQKTFKNFSYIEPVFLLDEYNELSNGQQKIINEMIRRRQPAFKMTTLPKSYVVERIKIGEQNDIDHDYDLVYLANKPLTPKSSELKPIKHFLENVWNNRIKPLGLNKKITQVLELPKPPSKKNQRRTKAELREINEYHYCGFQNFVIISTGNPKAFLDIMQLTINKAKKKGIDIFKKPIPTSIQLDAIQEYSRTRRGEIVQADAKLGRHLKRLIEYLGKYLHLKTEKTHDNYRSFSIENSEYLDEISYAVIEIGLKKSWLIQDDLGRVSKTEKIRLETMTLNNVLLPSFEVPLAEHQIWQMSNDDIESVVNQSKTIQKEEKITELEKIPVTKNIPIDAYGLLENISNLIKNDELIVFVGSGLSTFAGYPSATYLSILLRKKLGIDDTSLGLDQLCQYYFNDKEEKGFVELLKLEFQKISSKNLVLHKKLINLGITKFITTNWDSLIEDTCIELTKPFEVIVTPEQIQSHREKNISIYKIHGDIQHSSLLVATSTQYESYTTSHSYMITKLKALLQNKSVLFIGYSHSDYNFNQIRRLVAEELGNLKESYAILPDINDFQSQDLVKKNILVIKADFESVINELIDEK